MNIISTNDDNECGFEEIAEQFLWDLRCGSSPTIESFIQRYPTFEVEIRQHFPGLVLGEKLAAHKTGFSKIDLPLPFSIGRYELLSEIGRGGMGVVYNAIHAELEKEFAVKVVLHDKPDAAKRVKRFKQEAQAISSLHHPCIVPLVDFGNQENLFYIVMRKIDGLTFRQLVDTRYSDASAKTTADDSEWKLMASLFSEIADALHHVHQRGLVHRDIKPNNLLIDQESRVWITDFGLAKLSEESSVLSTTTGLVGTPRYIAPESTRGGGIADARSDVYSLGVTMFETFSGITPRNQESVTSNGNGKFSIPDLRTRTKDIPAALNGIVSRSCQFDPENRYQNAAELAEDLRRFALRDDRSLLRRLKSIFGSRNT